MAAAGVSPPRSDQIERAALDVGDTRPHRPVAFRFEGELQGVQELIDGVEDRDRVPGVLLRHRLAISPLVASTRGV